MTANNNFTVPNNIVIINNNRYSDTPRWYATIQAGMTAIEETYCRQLAEELCDSFIPATRIQEFVYRGTDGNYYAPIPAPADLALLLSGDNLYTPQNTYCEITRSFSDRQNMFTCSPYPLPAIPEHIYNMDELSSIMETLTQIMDSDREIEDELSEYTTTDAREMAARQLAINRRYMLDCLHNLADAAASYWATTSEENRQEQNDTYHNFLGRLMEAIARSL